jgi:hypothetical protein
MYARTCECAYDQHDSWIIRLLILNKPDDPQQPDSHATWTHAHTRTHAQTQEYTIHTFIDRRVHTNIHIDSKTHRQVHIDMHIHIHVHT